MKARIAPGVVLREDAFGGVAYVHSRDDFFALDQKVYDFVRSFSRTDWTDLAKSAHAAATQLGGLQILETLEPAVSPRPYSGPSFLGSFKDIVTLSEPLVLNCFATAHCPLNCIYCHADDLMSPAQRAAEDQGVDEVANVVAIASLVGSIVTVVTGGDPLTRLARSGRLMEGLADRRAMVVDTSGVGSEADQDALLELVAKHRAHLRVSLDSPDFRVHDRIRPINKKYITGQGSHQSAFRMVTAAIGASLPVTVQTVVSSANDTVEHLTAMRDFLVHNGVKHWVLHLAIEAGAARLYERRMRKGIRGGILPQQSARATVWRVVQQTVSEGLPIDIRVTDNENTPNSVLLLASDGKLYTEGLAHKGKVELFDPEGGRPDLVRKLFYYIDRFGHAQRYLNWNPDMFNGENLEEICFKIDLPADSRAVASVDLVERERKYHVADIQSVRTSLQELGYAVSGDEIIDDRYYDSPDRALTLSDLVLRTRTAGGRVLLAEKGPRFRRSSGEYDRVELELPVGDLGGVERAIFAKGLEVSWRLQRRRQTWTMTESQAAIVVDDLGSVGVFLEMEGPSAELEKLAAQLKGLGTQEPRNYRELILDWSRERGIEASDVYGVDLGGLLLRS